MAAARFSSAVALAAAMIGMILGGCSVAQSTPPPPRPFGEVAREEKGTVVTVNDTMIDLSTGTGRGLRAHSPTIPVGRVGGISLPVTIGGEKHREIPGEEIAVRLKTGKLIVVVQERGSPPFAPDEAVLVQYERASEVSGAARMRVVRE